MSDSAYSFFIPPGMDQASVQALINASVPVPASSMPPGVTDVGSVGTASPYARADHTHAGKARKQRTTGVSAATYVWTYPTAFAAGIVPICNAIVEDPADSANDSYNVQISGVATNTQCTFRIKRMTVVLGVLGLNATPGTVNLHLTAFEP